MENGLDRRFWAKVDKSGECWLWTGARNGSMKIKYGWLTRRDKQTRAHCWSWILHFGEIPTGLCVLHKCDNPPCVNPDHLFLGTKKDNAIDCASKGRLNSARWRVGEKSPTAKLTESIIREIRGIQNIPQNHIAAKFGISQANVSLIRAKKTWRHIH